MDATGIIGVKGSAKQRLDVVLTARGLFDSRAKASASVIAGEVLLGKDRERARKPGQMVADDVEVSVEGGIAFVSRGGIKMTNALDQLGLDVEGVSALDVGASTGGFTDCLLQRGARRVIALDVAYGELAWKLRQDDRVHVMERVNARHLEPAQLPWVADFVVCDVSFIALEKVLGAISGCCTQDAEVVALVKPQFEVGKERLGKGGVVRDADDRRDALRQVGIAAARFGFVPQAFVSSGLPGPKGNLESFVHLRPGSEVISDSSLEAMLMRAEP
ncbi:MAG: TlyA family RNA methyltransferase [Solirubrobacterales bacterium]|nr:TlyA family RNA methyltransferase [Solirubrobacterales bacterium]